MAKVRCELDTDSKGMSVFIDDEEISNVCSFHGASEMPDMYQSFGFSAMTYEKGESVNKMSHYTLASQIEAGVTAARTKFKGIVKAACSPVIFSKIKSFLGR